MRALRFDFKDTTFGTKRRVATVVATTAVVGLLTGLPAGLAAGAAVAALRLRPAGTAPAHTI